MDYTHLSKYYKGKRVFLTGHTGFKGAWMLSWLSSLGAEVKGYALHTENEYDLYNVIKGDEKCISVIADIRSKERLEKEIVNFQPDFIFHLAAQPLVRFSYKEPVETFETNTIGTVNLLNAIRFLKKPCIVVCITTDKVYENVEWHYPYRENDRLGGYDPYSASKACAELVISSYRKSFFNTANYQEHGKAIASVRAGNVIGGGDWSKDRIIPDIVRALKVGKPIHIRSPYAVRPWQHVLEPIGGYLHLATKMLDDSLKYSQAWNFGPLLEDNLTVIELAEIAIDIWGKGELIVPTLKREPHEAKLLKLDISKTTNILGWKPNYSAVQAIEKTIDWYKQEDAFRVTSQNIQEYAF